MALNGTGIEWCDATWNPVTGCNHGCPYCYARRIANRFGTGKDSAGDAKLHVLDEKIYHKDGRFNPYPFGFEPTFHRYRLSELSPDKKPQNIFVGSMSDLWGSWVPNDWKIEVFEAIKKAPQNNYLFLTKNPVGYSIWPTEKHPDFHDWDARTDNMWFGVTYTGVERINGLSGKVRPYSVYTNFWYLWRMSGNLMPGDHHTFLSVEPLGCDICEVEDEREGGRLLEHFLLPMWERPIFEWVVVGAETGNRTAKRTVKKEWVDKLVNLCDRAGIPIFMKESLLPVMGEENMRRDFPPELKRGEQDNVGRHFA